MPIATPYFDYSKYNYTAQPSGGNQNSITRTATDFGLRDFLIQKNIGGTAFPPTVFYPDALKKEKGIISPKIGEPFLDTSVNGNVNSVPQYYPIQQYGIIFKNTENISNNQFKDTTSNADTLATVDNLPKQIGGVIDNGSSTFTFGKAYFPLAGVPLSYPTKPQDPLIDSYGILAKTTFAKFTELTTLKNVYSVPDAQTDTSLGIDSQKVNEDFKTSHNGVTKGQGYLNQYGKLNQGGGSAMEAANVLGSVLGGGLGIAKLGGGGGVSTNFDLRSSLVGRILGATGTINDTNLGRIGGSQLALALANNTAFNVQQEILGKLNIQDNVLSLIKGNGLAGFRPNYQITVPSSGVGKFFNGAAKILGFTLPRSFISDEGSIFASENGNIENVKRANALLANTGKGQFVSLIKNANANLQGTTQYDNPKDTAFRSGYAPGYAVGDKESPLNGDNIYAYSNGRGNLYYVLNYSFDLNGEKSVIPDLNYFREKKTENSGFKDPDSLNLGPEGGKSYFTPTIKQVGFTWTSDRAGSVNVIDKNSLITGPKKSLMFKTQELFRSGGMLNMTVAKGNINPFYVEGSQTQTVNGGGMSKGSAVLKKEFFNNKGQEQSIDVKGDAGKVYARAWTTLDRYDKVSKLIRHRGLDDKVPYRNQMQGSVLDDNGFVKISPYIDVVDDPKKFMFSIENLAWNDQYFNLLPCERGSGDLLTGKKGRIMWFPPYDIQFSESNSVEWEANKFIGRGESVYTYSNTERSGNLSFKVVVDHPTYANTFSGNRVGNQDSPDDNYVASFFAGEIPPDELFSNKLTSYELDVILNEYVPSPSEKQAISKTKPTDTISYYFPNDVYTYYNDYETNGTETNPVQGQGYIAGQVTSKRNYNDTLDYGLNSYFVFKGQTYTTFEELLKAIAVFMAIPENAAFTVEITGYASTPGKNSANDELASKRSDTIIKMLKNAYAAAGVKDVDSNSPYSSRIKKIKNTLELGTFGCKVGEAEFTDQTGYDCKKGRKIDITFGVDYNLVADKTKFDIKRTTTPTTFKNQFYGECSFFEKLTQADSFIFDKFRDKIKYFHPAFHSTTPEGLNSRLTFLLQCTRQGPTLEQQGATNLAFGRPPICILRIGDFYNTKIVIDNVSFDYEPLVWDLNPEGIGVQPMIANVNISFKFIGGSTLLGPINKLQNALSFNYFANTHVYDVRADYLAKIKNPKSSKSPTSDYDLVNAAMDTITGKDGKTLIKGDLNKGVYTSEKTPKIELISSDQSQTKANDKITDGIQELIPDEPYSITNFVATFDGQTSDEDAKKGDAYFYVKVKWDVYDNREKRVIDLSTQGSIATEIYKNAGYLISIKNMITSEIYQENLPEEGWFVAYTINSTNGSTVNIPIKSPNNKNAIGNLGLTPSSDSFEISIIKSSLKTGKEVLAKQNIKLQK